MNINYLTLTIISDSIFIVDMLGNYLFKNSDYTFYKRKFNDEIPDTDAYIIIEDNMHKIESVIEKVKGKFIIIISHRRDKMFYENLLSLGISCIYDDTVSLELFDDIGLQMCIYYNGLSDDKIKEILKDLIK